MTAGEQSLGEIARRLDEVFQRYEHIANSLPATFVSREAFDSYKELVRAEKTVLTVQIEGYERRISELEDDKKWLWRLVVGAVILALLGFVISTTKAYSTPKSPSTSTNTRSAPLSWSPGMVSP